MKKQEKIFTVDNLTAQLKEAKSVVLANFRGLNVAQLAQLRSQVKKNGGQFQVVKNSLLKRALANLDLEIPEAEMEGPTAIIVAIQEELEPLKAVANFAKINTLPTFKSGIWEGKVLTQTEIEQLSLISGKNELMVQLLAVLASPTARLTRVIADNPKKLILILKRREGGEN